MRYLPVLVGLAFASACSSPPPQPPAEKKLATIPITTKSEEARTHFEKARVLFENQRMAESIAEVDAALKLDPDFQRAHALRGFVTRGTDGVKEVEAAAAAATSLPEAERLLIESEAAFMRGDHQTTESSLRRVTELAPGDSVGFFEYGNVLLLGQKYAEAAAALKKAVELNPSAGGAQNMLGYASLRQGDTAGAIAAFEQYARMLPQEPNAQDSLAEALLAAGRFKEAEATFQKALDLSKDFWAAHEGIAYAKAYSGDWKGAQAEFMLARDGAPRWGDKMQVANALMATAAAQKDFAGALRMADALDKMPDAPPGGLARVPLARGYVYIDWGRPKEAIAAANTALMTADSGAAPPGIVRILKREGLRIRSVAEAQLKDAAAAAKTSAALDLVAAAQPDDAQLQSAMHQARAMLLVAKGDAKGAQAEFAQCSREDGVCLWQAIIAADKAGDKATGDAVRADALKLYGRDPASLITRARFGTPAKTS